MTFDLSLTPAQLDLVERTHAFAEDVVRPVAQDYDRRQEFPWPVLEEAARQGCRYLRIDTNVRNTRARRLYHSLGYKEISVAPCTFNGLSDIDLVLLEKAL